MDGSQDMVREVMLRVATKMSRRSWDRYGLLFFLNTTSALVSKTFSTPDLCASQSKHSKWGLNDERRIV